MARFRQALRPVNSIKHVLDSEGALSGGVKSENVVAFAVPNVDSTTFVPGAVRVGGTINGIFLSVFIIGATGAGNTGSINWYIAKRHSAQAATFPNPGETGVSTVRNQIFHEEKGLAGSADGTPMAFKGVVAIPKSMRRMREGDAIIVVVRGTDATTDYNFCVKAIYKSYF